MKSTNFNPQMLIKINEVLKFVLKSPHSDFYREKYKNLVQSKIKTLDDFQKIPLLTKDELLSTPWEKRIYVSKDEIDSFAFSSGTTQAPIPMIMPRTRLNVEDSRKYSLNKELFEELGVNRVIILLQPTTYLFRRMITMPDPPAQMIAGDIQNLKITAKIMRELKINGISTTPTILRFLIDELEPLKFDLGLIKWIRLGGEHCSTVSFGYFKSKFPNAHFHMSYGNSEIGGIRHYRCRHLAASDAPNIFHIDHSRELLEIINEKDEICDLETAGELIHTDLETKAFPLIRYRLRDICSMQKEKCSCGSELNLKIGGRVDLDILKLHGSILHAELIHEALRHIQDMVEPFFEMHVFEEIIDGKPRGKLKLNLKLQPRYCKEAKNEIFSEIIKEKISANLQISSTMTLSDFIRKGIFMPLEIEFVPHWTQAGAKSRNIISHLS